MIIHPPFAVSPSSSDKVCHYFIACCEIATKTLPQWLQVLVYPEYTIYEFCSEQVNLRKFFLANELGSVRFVFESLNQEATEIRS